MMPSISVSYRHFRWRYSSSNARLMTLLYVVAVLTLFVNNHELSRIISNSSVAAFERQAVVVQRSRIIYLKRRRSRSLSSTLIIRGGSIDGEETVEVEGESKSNIVDQGDDTESNTKTKNNVTGADDDHTDDSKTSADSIQISRRSKRRHFSSGRGKRWWQMPSFRFLMSCSVKKWALNHPKLQQAAADFHEDYFATILSWKIT